MGEPEPPNFSSVGFVCFPCLRSCSELSARPSSSLPRGSVCQQPADHKHTDQKGAVTPSYVSISPLYLALVMAPTSLGFPEESRGS